MNPNSADDRVLPTYIFSMNRDYYFASLHAVLPRGRLIVSAMLCHGAGY
jgi:hypothetical protein